MRAAVAGAEVVHMPGQEPVKITATPFVWRDPATIPRRRFLYGFELQRGEISAVVAPGAAGKTSLKVARALCMVTGRDLLGHRVWEGPNRCWLWNLEDKREEVEKLIHAFCKLWDIGPADIGDRLFLDSAIDGPELKLAEEIRGEGWSICKPVVHAMIDELKARRIDYFDCDPFVSCHSVPENDNGAIDAVSKEWKWVASEASCAISLAHHVRKPQGGDATAFDARGAVAMINAARSVLVLNRMSEAGAQEMGIQPCDRKRFFSVYDDKNNRAPPALKAEWYEFVGVGLGNADVGSDGPEDNVGAVKRWTPPNLFGGVTPRQLYQIQKLVDEKQGKADAPRAHSSATHWIGKTVAYVLDKNLHDDIDRKQVEKMVKAWLSEGALIEFEGRDLKSEVRQFIKVGRWVEPESQ